MRTARSPRKTHPRAGCIPPYGLVAFDDPNLVSCAWPVSVSRVCTWPEAVWCSFVTWRE